MNDESNTNTVVVDGEAAISMRSLRNHSSLSYEELKNLVEHKLDADECFDPVLDFVKEKVGLKSENNRPKSD